MIQNRVNVTIYQCFLSYNECICLLFFGRQLSNVAGCQGYSNTRKKTNIYGRLFRLYLEIGLSSSSGGSSVDSVGSSVAG